jgi:hypothetical protein
LALIAVVAALPVAAQVEPEGPRYELVPGDGGVTRIDTATGEVVRCALREGAWVCEASPERSEISRVSDALNALTSKVDDLTQRLDRMAAAAPPPVVVRSEPTFAGQVVGRFVEMIRRLKQARAG